MNYEHLRHLLRIKRFGSISRAAEYGFISQPHLSNIVQSFEEELGYKLFKRSRSGATPTPESAAFFKQAELVLKSISEFQDYFKTSSKDVFRLKLGSVPYCYASETITTLLKENKLDHVDVRLETLHSFVLPQRIIDHSYDLGFMSYNTFFHKYIEDTFKYNQLNYVEVARFTPKLLISKKHPYYNVLKNNFSELKNHTMVRDSALEDDIVQTYDIFHKTDITLPEKNYITTNSDVAINYYVASGMAYTISLHFNIYDYWLALNGIEAFPILDLEDTISMGYIYNSDIEFSPAIRTLIQTWKNVLAENNIL